MKKSIVILSAGLDSTVNLFMAYQQREIPLVITFDYGQKAASKEIEAAAQLCSYLKLNHKVIDLRWFKDFNSSSLIQSNLSIPTGEQVSISSLVQSVETMKSVWVPNRNGIFLNIAAGFAESLGAEEVIPGFNREEAATFPDNSKEFMLRLTEAFEFSTRNQVKVHCWTIDMNKTEIVKKAIELKVPLLLIWPCYFGGDHWCGECESCQRSRRAFEEAGLDILNYFIKRS